MLFKARTNEENDLFAIDQTFNIPVQELSDENSSESSSEYDQNKLGGSGNKELLSPAMVMSKNVSYGISNQTSAFDTDSDNTSSQMSASLNLNYNKFARLNMLRRNSVNAHNQLLNRINTQPGKQMERRESTLQGIKETLAAKNRRSTEVNEDKHKILINAI